MDPRTALKISFVNSHGYASSPKSVIIRKYLCGHLFDQPRSFSLYGNDVEIFDFRPGRYHTEASLHEDGEWMRIWLLFESLLSDKLHTSESGARSDGRWDRDFFLELGGFWDKSGGYSFLDLCLRADERDVIFSH